MEFFESFAAVPALVLIVYLAAEGLKLIKDGMFKKYIPVFCGALGGILGVVLPSSILLLEQYVPLRKAIREMSELHIVARLGNYVFEDALTDVSFVIIKKKESSSFIPQTIWCRNKLYGSTTRKRL